MLHKCAVLCRKRVTWILVVIASSVIIFSLVFITNPKARIQSIVSTKQRSLLERNNERLVLLNRKYGTLLNLSEFITNSSAEKAMIYSCKSFCGGWGDRLRGITSVYILALLTHRRFMIDMNYPCQIAQALEPNLVNWTYIQHTSLKNRTRLLINTVPSWPATARTIMANTVKSEDFVKQWSAYDEVWISTNSDYMTSALHNPYLSSRTRTLLGRFPRTQVKMQTLFALLFEFLFKPTLPVQIRVNSILAAAYHHHLICLHIRIGKNPTNPLDYAFTTRGNTTQHMLNFLDMYLLNYSSPFFFVTSDSGQAISDVLHHFPNSSMTIAGPILHIDRFDRKSSTICDGFIKAIADFYVLGECQTSLLSRSGFSSWANHRRLKPNENLYYYFDKIKTVQKG
ncbi:unnamed protein product [Adineta steineri]|uniref:Uncharacterized protein n=1 Tax=Adineta steineri TaxID=433720 RepID=A0A816DI34_9BILA|nr:unnamed protein product [Adineta steineri]